MAVSKSRNEEIAMIHALFELVSLSLFIAAVAVFAIVFGG